jgi:hypothetical protein
LPFESPARLVTPALKPTLVAAVESMLAGVGFGATVVAEPSAGATAVVCADETTGDSSVKAAIISTPSRTFFM